MRYYYGRCDRFCRRGSSHAAAPPHHTRNASASLTQYDAPVGSAASLKS